MIEGRSEEFKEFLEGFIEDLRSNDEFARLVFYCFASGLRTLSQEVQDGRDDNTAKLFTSWRTKSGLQKYHTIH